MPPAKEDWGGDAGLDAAAPVTDWAADGAPAAPGAPAAAAPAPAAAAAPAFQVCWTRIVLIWPSKFEYAAARHQGCRSNDTLIK